MLCLVFGVSDSVTTAQLNLSLIFFQLRKTSSSSSSVLFVQSNRMEFKSLPKFCLLLCLSIFFLSSFLAQAKINLKYCGTSLSFDFSFLLFFWTGELISFSSTIGFYILFLYFFLVIFFIFFSFFGIAWFCNSLRS